jgi:deleted-in-malignant-brain-tumors protein 1
VSTCENVPIYQYNTNIGIIRLVNGDNSYEGRIEIYHNSTWLTVSSIGWSKQDAIVSCHQLGFSNSIPVAVLGGYYGKGNSSTAFQNIACVGNELSILNCSYSIKRRLGYDDAGLRCVPKADNVNGSACGSGDVRIADSNNGLIGRVEICIGGVWGTIVSTFFTYKEAQVVCRQLGHYDRFAQRTRNIPGAGPILLSMVKCTGSESRILNCDYNGPSSASTHYTDLAIICLPKVCKFGELRLVNGTKISEGRVELCIAGVWGTIVGDYYFNNKAASVICRQLGFSPNNSVPFNFGPGKDPIYLRNVECTGKEQMLLNCSFSTFVYYNRHSQDAGVKCELFNDLVEDLHLSPSYSSTTMTRPTQVYSSTLMGAIPSSQLVDTMSTQSPRNSIDDNKIAQIFIGITVIFLVLCLCLFVILIIFSGYLYNKRRHISQSQSLSSFAHNGNSTDIQL